MNNKAEIRFTAEIVRANMEEGIKSALANAKDDEFESHADDRQQIAELRFFLDSAIETWQRHADYNVYADTATLVRELHEQFNK